MFLPSLPNLHQSDFMATMMGLKRGPTISKLSGEVAGIPYWEMYINMGMKLGKRMLLMKVDGLMWKT